MTDTAPPAAAERTAWARSLQTPLRRFLRTETGSAAVLLGATVVALAWANIAPGGYQAVWRTTLSVTLGGAGVSLDLHGWVNSGLMTLFFLVVGLEARREFDLGELRERRRLALPLLAGLGGMVVPIAIFLAVNAGRSSAHGWGTAMSTDTAFALGMLALVAPRSPDRLRSFLLTFSVVDDLTAIIIIALAYSRHITMPALLAGLATLVVVLAVRLAGVRRGLVFAALGLVAWTAFVKSGVDPVVTGLAMGLLTPAYPAARGELEQATARFRLFREQPTPELARVASIDLARTISPNERLQETFHPWTSYLIVPLFALANAGLVISGPFLARSFTSPVTLGILAGYVLGKPAGAAGVSWLVTVASRGRLRPPAGWASVTGAGTIAGIGFTVSLLIA
ncbi:MAG: Na+/H+ antiporter NhaA, partial [Gemmatimonadota bacterium]